MSTVYRCFLIEQGSGRLHAPGQVHRSQVILNRGRAHNTDKLNERSRFNGICAGMGIEGDSGLSTATFEHVKKQVLEERCAIMGLYVCWDGANIFLYEIAGIYAWHCRLLVHFTE